MKHMHHPTIPLFISLSCFVVQKEHFLGVGAGCDRNTGEGARKSAGEMHNLQKQKCVFWLVRMSQHLNASGLRICGDRPASLGALCFMLKVCQLHS